MRRLALFLLSWSLCSFVLSQKPELWVSIPTGAYGFGEISRLDTTSKKLDSLYLFEPAYITPSGPLTKGADGYLYGVGQYACASGGGIYRIDPDNNEFRMVYFFADLETSNLLAGQLKEYEPGVLTGISQAGVIFEFNYLTRELKEVYKTPTNDYWRAYHHLKASNGRYYVWSESNELLEIDTEKGTQTVVIDVEDQFGRNSLQNLLEVREGYLISSTRPSFGSQFSSLVFGYNLETKEIDSLSSYPYGLNYALTPPNFIKTTEGRVFGTVLGNGDEVPYGILFELDTATFEYIHRHSFSIDSLGLKPIGTLTEGANGKLYGGCYDGGDDRRGTLFEYDPATNSIANTGVFRNGRANFLRHGLTAYAPGEIAGVVSDFGPNLENSYFEWSLENETIKDELLLDCFQNHGTTPNTELLQHFKTGKVYGTAQRGGRNEHGILFELDQVTGRFYLMHDFDSTVTGKAPLTGLVQGQSGLLFGTTSEGGAFGMGTLFQFDPATKNVAVLHDFSATMGERPNNGLVIYKDSLLIGMNRDGGNFEYGLIYQYNLITKQFFVLHHFDNTILGRYPEDRLVIGLDGLVYGIANSIIFSLDPKTAQLTPRAMLNSSTGGSSWGHLTEVTPGRFFGLGRSGGKFNNGTIFEYNSETDSVSIVHDFYLFNDGQIPESSMTYFDGKLYGFAGQSINGYGVFSFDPTDFNYTTEFFLPSNALYDVTNSVFSVVDPCLQPTIVSDITSCQAFQDPLDNLYEISGVYPVTLMTTGGCDSSVVYDLTVVNIDSGLSQANGTLFSSELDATYQWINLSTQTMIKGADSASFTPTETGLYAVVLNKNICTDTSSAIFYESVITSTQNDAVDFFSISPNPSFSNFTITFAQVTSGHLTVQNIHGREVHHQRVLNENQLEFSHSLETGLYLIHFLTEDGLPWSQKIVIQ